MTAPFSVNGSEALMTLRDDNPEGTQLLDSVNVSESEITFSAEIITGGGESVVVGAYYRAAIDLSTYFKMELVFDLVANEVNLVAVRDEVGIIGSSVISVTYSPGVPIRVRIRSTSFNFVRVWNSNDPEPDTWNLVTGPNPTGNGTVGLSGFAFSSDPLLVTVAFDNFQVFACVED